MLELQNGNLIRYPGAVKLSNLVDWLRPYSLKDKIEREQDKVDELFIVHEIDKMRHMMMVVDSYQEFSHLVLNRDEIALVYFATANDHPHLLLLTKFAKLHEYVTCIWYKVNDANEIQQYFGDSKLKLPAFRSFRNNLKSFEKWDSQAEVKVPVYTHENAYELVLAQVQDNFEADVKLVSEEVFY
jgi:hypothetical protein